MPAAMPPCVATRVPTRQPLSRSEKDLLRRSRRTLREQRSVSGLGCETAAGPRRVCRLGPAATGMEHPMLAHHPRSSLPSFYGYSLHSSKGVTGIDLRGVGD